MGLSDYVAKTAGGADLAAAQRYEAMVELKLYVGDKLNAASLDTHIEVNEHTEPMTHWKKLTHPDYLGAYALDDGRDRTFTIDRVEVKMVNGPDGKQEECIVCSFKDAGIKPMILNRTNCKQIERLYNTPHIEEWSGKMITIYVAKVKAFGDTVDALRIRPIVPTVTKPKLTPSDPAWEKAVAALKAGTTTVAAIKERFELSSADEKKLTA